MDKVNVFEEAYELGYKAGMQEALERHYISVERLKKMTLAELVEFIDRNGSNYSAMDARM